MQEDNLQKEQRHPLQLAEWYLAQSKQTGHDLGAALAAYALLRSAGAAEQAAALALSLAEQLERLGLYDLWEQLCEELLISSGTPDRYAAEAQRQLGMIAAARGAYASAREHYRLALLQFQQQRDRYGIASVQHQLGNLALLERDYARATTLYRAAASGFRSLDDNYVWGSLELQLGTLALIRGAHQQAHAHYETAHGLFEACGDQLGAARALGQLGILARKQGRMLDAVSHTAHAYQIFQQFQAADREKALRCLAELRAEMATEMFATAWAQATGNQPLPALLAREEADLEPIIAQINALCDEVIAALQSADRTRREAFAAQLETLAPDHPLLALDGASDFIALLAAWLRGKQVDTQAEALQSDFCLAYKRMAERVAEASDQQDTGEDLRRQLLALVSAPGWQEAQQLIEAHPILLSPSAEAMLILMATEQNAWERFAPYWGLLERCREIGIAAAFAEL
ncbi:MAG: hypothetical protein KatS3mg057_3188 [Herpetosiphonaceae bacterium]|nr:MAG: hypothetical protein KatS3mg057_3188 [Herpetosiphonaceae bacterium]